jgi:hypothetical protein
LAKTSWTLPQDFQTVCIYGLDLVFSWGDDALFIFLDLVEQRWNKVPTSVLGTRKNKTLLAESVVTSLADGATGVRVTKLATVNSSWAGIVFTEKNSEFDLANILK